MSEVRRGLRVLRETAEGDSRGESKGARGMSEQSAQFFTTVSDMRAVPAEKIDHFCEDLRLWLHMHKQVEQIQAELGPLAAGLKIMSPTEAFGWVDDGRHDARIQINLHEHVVPPQAD